MYRRLLAAALALCLVVGFVTQISIAQEPKTLEERVAALEAKVAELTETIKELNQRLEMMLEVFQERFTSVSDRARVGAAKAELATIKNGLGMYQAESDFSAYPSTETITNYKELRNVLAQYVRLPEEGRVSFTFLSYTSTRPDTFVLVARARDRNQTTITVTPTSIKP